MREMVKQLLLSAGLLVSLGLWGQAGSGSIRLGEYQKAPLQAPAMRPEQAINPAVGLPSSQWGDWRTDAFWGGTAPAPSTISLDGPIGLWNEKDRVGDARRKQDRWTIRWRSGNDSYICIRFDMRRVVTTQIMTESGQHGEYLPGELYTRMRTQGTSPLISEKALFDMYITFALGEDGLRYQGRPYNFSLVQFNDFLVPGREVNTAYLGRSKPMKLTVPTNWLRYPDPATNIDGAPAPAWNMIILKTNFTSLKDGEKTLVSEAKNWIHWRFDSELSYKAVAPIFLVHGTDAQSDTWMAPAGDSFVDFFTSRWGTTEDKAYPGPWSYDINLGTALHGNDTINENAKQLGDRLNSLMAWFGAKYCHLIGHSKGGSDSRQFLEYLNNGFFKSPTPHPFLDKPFRVLSLTTLGTPHGGTVLADIGYQNALAMQSPFEDVSSYNPNLRYVAGLDWVVRLVGGTFGPEGINPAREGALFDQQTWQMMGDRWYKDKTAAYLTDKNNKVHFYCIRGDADADGNKWISNIEGHTLMPGAANTVTQSGTAMYRALGNNQSVSVVERLSIPTLSSPFRVITLLLIPNPAPAFIPNDLVSATALGPKAIPLEVSPFAVAKPGFQSNYLGKNHSEVKSVLAARKILERIMVDFIDLGSTYAE